MSELRLRPLRIEDEAAALDAHHELTEDDFAFLLEYEAGTDWSGYVARMDGYRQGADLPGGRVPAAFLVAIVDGELVGRSSIRLELNEYLALAGGHIGYGVRPAHRRRGHATEILRQSLVVARSHGVDEALVTCSVDNVGSRRVIEACGGEFDGIVDDTREGVQKRRYWIR